MKERWSIALIIACVLPFMLYLAACDDDGKSAEPTVTTQIVAGETVYITNYPPEPQSLYDETHAVSANDSFDTDEVEAPGDGTITVTVDWGEGDQASVFAIKNGAIQNLQAPSGTPFVLVFNTLHHDMWRARILNTIAPLTAKSFHIRIDFEPND